MPEPNKTSEQPTVIQEKDPQKTKSTETTRSDRAKFKPKSYKKQELIKDRNGNLVLETDEKTGIVTKTLKMSEPLVPSDETLDPDYEAVYHQVGTLNGKRVSYKILAADRETVLDTIDCATVDR